MIQPTPGRVVWYYPSAMDLNRPAPMTVNGLDPLMAHVVAVHNERCVSLAVFDAEAHKHARLRVQLLQGDDQDAPVGDEAHCTWMPYQKQQAMKHDLSNGLLGAAAAVLDNVARAPHQQRVIDELAELSDKYAKLVTFIGMPKFGSLDLAEQERLKKQAGVMQTYSEILEQRIAAF